MDEKGFAFVEIREANKHDDTNEVDRPSGTKQLPDTLQALKPFFKRALINNDGFNPESALERIKYNLCTAVAFGKLSITNPNLPERIRDKLPLNTEFDFPTFYSGGEKGYTTY